LDSGIIPPPSESTDGSALETSESQAWHEVDPWLQYAVFGVVVLLCCFCSFIAYRHVANRKLKYEVRKEQLDADIAATAEPHEYQVEGHCVAAPHDVEEQTQFDGFIPTGNIDPNYHSSTHKAFHGIVPTSRIVYSGSSNPTHDSSTHNEFHGEIQTGIPTIGMDPELDSSFSPVRENSLDNELYGEGVSMNSEEGTKKREPEPLRNSDYIMIDGDETAPTVGASQKKLDLIVLHQDTSSGDKNAGEQSPNGVSPNSSDFCKRFPSTSEDVPVTDAEVIEAQRKVLEGMKTADGME